MVKAAKKSALSPASTATDGNKRYPKDYDLMQRVAANDAAAISLLYKKYVRLLQHTALLYGGKAGLDDIVQLSFIQLWKNAATYDGQRANLSTWIFTIAHRETVNWKRKDDRWHKKGAVPLCSINFRLADARLMSHSPELRSEITATISGAKLTDKEKTILTARFAYGMTMHRIAIIEGMGINTVKRMSKRAIAKLQERLVSAER